jgi:hypothetical protein
MKTLITEFISLDGVYKFPADPMRTPMAASVTVVGL